MFDKTYLLPSDALKILLDSLSEVPISAELLMIDNCYGRIIASDIVSSEDLPPFSRSTVDGFAVNSGDTFGAKENAPAYLMMNQEVFMGAAPAFVLRKGEAARIPTGGMLPSGSDAVVMLEHAQIASSDMIEVLRSVAPSENVITKGEDITKGEKVLAKGRKLRAQDIGALAGIGITEVMVYGKPVVAIISTGDEIVPPTQPLGLGQIRDINSYTLSGLISEHGGIPMKKGIFIDAYEAIAEAVEDALQDSDIVLISGGTSAGTKDMTSMIINDIGRPGVLFHGVSLKPGKPMIGGIINGKPILGLPGHPAAIVVCFDLFIRPLIEKIGGLDTDNYFLKTVKAKMIKNIASAAGREDHIRVHIEDRGGEYVATPVLGKSGLITTLVRADGMVTIPYNKLGLDSGEEVTVKVF